MRFEDLLVWQKARKLTARIYQFSSSGKLSKDFSLRDQMRRSAVSVMSNIAEGFDRSSKAEYAQFLSIAKGSCAELRSQLYITLDSELLETDPCNALLVDAEEISRMLGSLQSKVKSAVQK